MTTKKERRVRESGTYPAGLSGHSFPGGRDVRFHQRVPQPGAVGANVAGNDVRRRPRSRVGVLVYGTYNGQRIVGAIAAVTVFVLSILFFLNCW
jgi:hypothetical protein